MRFSIFMSLMCSAATVWSQDTSKLPTDAQKVVDAYDADAAKLRSDMEKALDKKALDTIGQLRKAQDIATKKGDLDGAVAIKNKIAALVPKDALTKSDKQIDLSTYAAIKLTAPGTTLANLEVGIARLNPGGYSIKVVNIPKLPKGQSLQFVQVPQHHHAPMTCVSEKGGVIYVFGYGSEEVALQALPKECKFSSAPGEINAEAMGFCLKGKLLPGKEVLLTGDEMCVAAGSIDLNGN